MPLPVPNLDDRTFAELVAEGRSLIPRYSRRWTNHNPSDPGITLLELFAHVVESALFQLNQVPPRSAEHFLRLAGNCRHEGESRDEATARSVRALDEPVRAVTAADVEAIARRAAVAVGQPLGRVACVIHRDAPATATVCVLVVPDEPHEPAPTASLQLVEAIFRELSLRRLVGTRIRVVRPAYVGVRVETTVVRRRGSGLTAGRVEPAVRDFLHPLRGGPSGTGWPFGRPVYHSELFQVLESLDGVDHVSALRLRGPNGSVAPEPGVVIDPLALVVPLAVNVTVVDEEPS